jgi:uncharacterized membrane protein
VLENYHRYWEIDLLRGIAIIMMIIYHIFYDINFLDIYTFNLQDFSFKLFLYPIGTIFLLLVGISLTLSYNRSKKDLTKNNLIKKFVFRGLKIFFLGLIITLVTFFYLGQGFIIFGVLHCIGISIILSIIFMRFRFQNIILAIIFIIFGIVLSSMTFDFNLFLFLGFRPVDFYTVDYFPLFPWFGVILFGIALGNIFYPDYKRIFSLPDFSKLKIVKFFNFLGRNSLIIYFLHQPILLFLIQLFSTLN